MTLNKLFQFFVPKDKIPNVANIIMNPNNAVFVIANVSPKPIDQTGVTSNCSNGEWIIVMINYLFL